MKRAMTVQPGDRQLSWGGWGGGSELGGGTREKKNVSFFGQGGLLPANMIAGNGNESEAQTPTRIGTIGCAYPRDKIMTGR